MHTKKHFALYLLIVRHRKTNLYYIYMYISLIIKNEPEKKKPDIYYVREVFVE